MLDYCFYLPANFDVDAHVSLYPPTDIDKFDKDKLLYIIHYITIAPSISKSQRNRSGFVDVPSRSLRPLILKYKSYLLYLMNTGVIIGDPSYSTDQHFSKAYRFTDFYDIGDISVYSVPVVPGGKFRTSAFKRPIAQSKDDSQEIAAKLQRKFFEDLDIDIEASSKYLNDAELDLIKNAETLDPQQFRTRKREILVSIHRIHNRDIRMVVDGTSGRLHSNLTSLKKEFRHFLSYKGESLVGIDISCSQPYISQVLMTLGFWIERSMPFQYPDSWLARLNAQSPKLASEKTRNIDPVNLDDIIHRLDDDVQGFVKKQADIMLMTKSDNSTIKLITHKLDRYKTIVNTEDIYEILVNTANGLTSTDPHFRELLLEYTAEEGKPFEITRKQMKLVALIALYSKPGSTRTITQIARYIFKGEFPEVTKLFNTFKTKETDKYSTLSHVLQATESYIMLEKILPRIHAENPDIPLFTIHDSVLTTAQYEEYVKGIIEDEFTKAIGHKPGVKMEYYNPAALRSKGNPTLQKDDEDVDITQPD